MEITSLQNPAIKNIVKLSKRKEREQQQRFLIEGGRELSLALQNNYSIEKIYLFRSLFEQCDYRDILQSVSAENIVEISQPVFEKIAYRENSDGLVAVAKSKIKNGLQNIHLSGNPFVIVLEAVEKPGNLGAILRTADAAGVDAVVVCDPQTDLFNPNVVRSSVGTLFSVQTAACTSQEALDWLSLNKISVYAAELQASEFYHHIDFKKPSAIVMGTEADGLTDFWLSHATGRIKIPMCGAIDSLNVSVSTAVLTFEAMRQRGFVSKEM